LLAYYIQIHSSIELKNNERFVMTIVVDDIN
jgi:hypothetical protein